MSKTAFERYAPFIQEYIYRKNWKDLREVQVEACSAILDTDDHVIIASGTASGKTEAAFFPVLTKLHENPVKSIGVIYISPLKALINDQFERLNGLLEESHIPVWPWHGDIPQSIKKRALKERQGVLQITPESLESMLMRHPGDAARLFSDLRFVVIDEIHVLMGTDRGLQVLCLLSRLGKLARCNPRRIGLSATLSDYESAMRFMAGGTERKVQIVGLRMHERTISLCVESFEVPDDPAKAGETMQKCNKFIYENSHNKKCLIFTNSRHEAESVIANMKEIALRKHDRDVFYVHHGSVSRALREETEMALRESDGPIVAAATVTLELGIDIGDLDRIIQIGSPYTCSSFVQRLGRSGRRTGKSQMMFVNLEHRNSGVNVFNCLPWNLLTTIAVIQLYLEERWIEPFVLRAKPYSLLAHQTLSVLMSHGELSPPELVRNVLTLPPFRHTITQEEYRDLLQYMLANDYLERMETGAIILGLKGERLANYYSFYAVFQDTQEYRVLSERGAVGTLDYLPAVGDVFVLAGYTWKAEAVDEERKTVYVVPERNKKIPQWTGSKGDVHTRVIQRIRQALIEEKQYPYLQPQAVDLLERSRDLARKSGILERRIIPYGEQSFLLCPWVGTKVMRTMAALFSCGLKDPLEIKSVRNDNYYIEITSKLSADEFFSRLRTIHIDPDDPDLFLKNEEAPQFDKYDFLVPQPLLRKSFLYNRMDLPGALEVIEQLV